MLIFQATIVDRGDGDSLWLVEITGSECQENRTYLHLVRVGSVTEFDKDILGGSANQGNCVGIGSWSLFVDRDSVTNVHNDTGRVIVNDCYINRSDKSAVKICVGTGDTEGNLIDFFGFCQSVIISRNCYRLRLVPVCAIERQIYTQTRASCTGKNDVIRFGVEPLRLLQKSEPLPAQHRKYQK